jgi:septal ring factor EnvC (AmiA/AmiB activator)
MRLIAATAFLVLVGVFASADEKDDVIKNRSKLDNVKRELARGRKQLDSLRAEEKKLQKTSAGYDQRISSDKKVVSRLGAQLADLQSQIRRTEQEQGTKQAELEASRLSFLDNLRQFYCLYRAPQMLSLSDPNTELVSGRKVVYLSAITGYQQGKLQTGASEILKAEEKLAALSGKSAELASLKRKKETSVALAKTKQEKAEKALARLRRLSRQQSDRLVSLEQSAAEMERLVNRLEQERKAAAARKNKPTRPSGSSAFAQRAGSLPMPYQGEIVQSFGPSTDPITNLRSYSPGITIKGKAGGPVIAVGAGEVAYAGELRGYGTFVIINHDDQYYTTYAGLSALTVSVGDPVSARTRLGVADQTGLVRFELRKGGDEVDPITWLSDE